VTKVTEAFRAYAAGGPTAGLTATLKDVAPAGTTEGSLFVVKSRTESPD
jgi:hypothetical protein